MDPSMRVCPFCGRPPGDGVFCAACGRNLSAVDRLPTAAEFEAVAPAERPRPVADLVREETDAFLAAARAAGEPGAETFPTGKPGLFRRAPEIRGWVVRPVDREDFEKPRRYEPGLVLSVAGRLHQLDSELRGWGQRDFPRYHHTASPEPIEPSADERLLAELRALRAAHGL